MKVKVLANFKMNKTRKETKEYLEKLEKVDKGGVEVTIFPPMSALLPSPLVGAQNGYPAEKGAFTGEVGLEQLREFGIDKILIGHSERRQLGETPQFLREKSSFYLENGFQVFFCIGEPMEVHQQGKEAIGAYLLSQLEGIDLSHPNLHIAYEPVWAIGQKVTPSLEMIENIGHFIEKNTQKPILYGGGVKKDNVQEILELSPVEGVLVGSASLDFDHFAQIIQIAKSVAERKQ
jgi:triosephosphate isomerase